MPDLSELKQQAQDAIHAADTLNQLEELRVSLLGKKGSITSELKNLGKLPAEERKSAGQQINMVKQDVAALLEQRKASLEKAAIARQIDAESVDVTLPARDQQPTGSIHPISRVMDEIITIFTGMGFAARFGPDIEDDFHNFTALNIPEEHPARQMHDTFYLQAEEGQPKPVLRTHTSPVQIRTMCSGKPPFRIIAPGSTFRCDSDATHTPMFHQVEGLVIGKDIHMGHLKGCLIEFLRHFFKLEDVPLRFRSSFFPFTEPSAEVDIACKRSKDGVVIGAGDDWLEILGCGMVHPNVLKNCNIDPDEWQGFAFGMGVERLAMLKYGMADLRQFYEGDLRWLKHYGFHPLRRPTLAEGVSA